MRTMCVVPEPNDAVQVLVPPRLPPECVSALLVYADLLLSGDSRNREEVTILAAEYLPG